MNEFDDLRLMAYVDGELSADDRALIETAVAENAELARRVSALRQSNALLGGAFESAAQGEMPALRAFARPAAEVSRNAEQRPIERVSLWQLLSRWFGSEQTLHWQPMATCALVLSVVSASSGYWFSSERQLQGYQQAGVLTPVETQALERVMNQALETRLSGDSLEWSDQRTGRGGVITPVRTFKTEQGRFCREFTDQRAMTGDQQEQRGIACRSADGNWQVRARYFL